MLTKNDLSAIKQIIDLKVDTLEIKIDKKLKPIKSQLNKIQRDINSVTRVFDADIIDLNKRTDKLESVVFLNP